MQRRRFLRTTALGAGAAAFLAACGGGDESKPAGQATSAPGGGSPAAGAQATTAPAAAKAQPGGVVTAAMARDVTTFDSIRSQDVYSAIVMANVCDSLYEVNKEGTITGRLVEKTENPEPNIYVMTLRKGVKFHDGTDVNAEAVKFSLQRHRDAPNSTRAQDVKDITAIDTPDATTVRITLKGPFAPFPDKLTGGAGTIYSPAAVQKLGENLARDLTGAGSGPFKFVEWKKDTQAVVEKNPAYWLKDADGSALPYVDRIVYKPFPDENVRLTNLKTGEVDMLIGNPPYKDVADLKKDTSLVMKQIPGLGFSFIMMNTEKEPFNNPAIRRAFSYAIDREQIRKTVFFDIGNVLDSPVPESIPWAYDKSGAKYLKRDIAKAKQELAAGGKPNGFKFTFQISNASPELQQTAELIKDQIKEAGLDMEIQLIEFATVVANGGSGDYQTLGLGWSGGVDPDGNLYSLFYTKAGFNFMKYSNPQLDKLLDDGRTTLDRSKRAEIYKQAQRILWDEQPMIVYFNAPQISTVRKALQNYPQTYNAYWGARDFDKIWKQK
jgi:peptide/nickel transport system substrate-binding protein